MPNIVCVCRSHKSVVANKRCVSCSNANRLSGFRLGGVLKYVYASPVPNVCDAGAVKPEP